MNLVFGPASEESFVAQWLEHTTGVRKVIVYWKFLSGTQTFFLSRALDLRGNFSIDDGDGNKNVTFEMN